MLIKAALILPGEGTNGAIELGACNDLAVKLKISGDTIKEYLNRLKNKGLLKRGGRRKMDYWKVTK